MTMINSLVVVEDVVVLDVVDVVVLDVMNVVELDVVDVVVVDVNVDAVIVVLVVSAISNKVTHKYLCFLSSILFQLTSESGG